jgi:uncharacterized delta-60 repeat protein
MTRRARLVLETLTDRITPGAGSLDPEFGTGGLVTTPLGPNDDRAFRVRADDDGKYVVGGYSGNGSDTDFALVRYSAGGTLDSSFGTGGRAATPFGAGDDGIYDFQFDETGRIVAVGYGFNGSDTDFALVRYTADGTLDESFGTAGVVTTPAGPGNDYARSVAFDSLGRIVVGGWGSAAGGQFNFVVARYAADGTPDASFGTAGQVVSVLSAGPDMVNSLALDAAGRVIVAGQYHDGVRYQFALARYDEAGVLDPTFGGSGGTVGTAISTRDSGIQAVALDDAGRIVAGGWGYNAPTDDLALARYNPDGSLDGSFGFGGKVMTPVGPDYDTIQSLQIDAAGRLVVGGYASNGGDYDFLVARYLPNGLLDPAFGTAGVVRTPLGAADDQIESLAIDAAGRIVVAGQSWTGTDYDFAVARYFSEPVGLATGDRTLTFTEDAGPLPIDPVLAVTNSPAPILIGATVRVGNYVRDEDVLSYTLQGGISAGFDALTGTLTLSGAAAVADYEAVLRSLTYTNTSHQPIQLDRTITIAVDDGEAAQNLAAATYTVQVVAVNDAPAFTSDGVLFAILQGNTTSIGQKVAGLFAGRFADPDTGASLSGVAVVGNTADPTTEGRWRYSTDNGGTWHDVGTVADGVTALALSAATRLRFEPVLSFTGQPTPLAVRALDDAFGGAFTTGAARQTIDVTTNGGVTPIADSPTPLRTTVFPAGTGGNSPPMLAGVPVSATIDEGQTLTFTATATDVDLAPVLTFSLDGAPPAAAVDPDTGAFTWTTTEADGPDTYVFHVQVSDGLATTIRPVTVQVREVNAAPVLADVPATAKLVRGDTLTFTATAADPDNLNGLGNALTFSLVNAPAGASIDPDTGAFTWTPADVVPAGDYTFSVRVVDDGVPARSHTRTITITLSAGLLDGGDLVIGGTAGNDTVTVSPTKDGTKAAVTVNKVKLGEFDLGAITGRIVVRTGPGADKVTIAAKLAKPTLLDGGSGNDVLTGGAGADTVLGGAGDDKLAGGKGDNVLVGGDGNDKLTGGVGRDVLIGGTGADKLAGAAGDDLLVAGPTAFDVDLSGLTDLFAEWTSGSAYADRVLHLTGTAGGANGGTYLTSATVPDDGVKDVLTGSAGADWFAVSAPAGAADALDLKAGEQKLVV